MDPVGPDRQRVGGVETQEGEADQGGWGSGWPAQPWDHQTAAPAEARALSRGPGAEWRCARTLGVPGQGGRGQH